MSTRVRLPGFIDHLGTTTPSAYGPIDEPDDY